MVSPSASTKKEGAENDGELNLDDIILTIPTSTAPQGALTFGRDEDWPQAMKSLLIDEERVGSIGDGTSKSKPSEIAFENDQAPPLAPVERLNRNISNQSTIDSALSRNSHLDTNDPGIRRMFGLNASSNTERQRRLRLLMDQCETVRFPFKKRLILGKYAFCCSIYIIIELLAL